MRKAVRINPDDPALMMALAQALSNQLDTREAIELYWRAFGMSESIDDKTSLTSKMVPLYEQINQVDLILERFQRERQEEDKRREMTICLAQAYQTMGDLVSAKVELESLLSEDTRDTNLLQQIAKLCESNGELDAAIAYQRQLVGLAPGHETEFPLAAMLRNNGETEEATEINVRLTMREEDPLRFLRSIDSLLNQESYEIALQVVNPRLAQQRDDWELLYREGLALIKLEKYDEAKLTFQRLIDIKLPIDTLSRTEEERFKQALRKAKSDEARGIVKPKIERPTMYEMLSAMYSVRQALESWIIRYVLLLLWTTAKQFMDAN